jgi:hypothetical protein
MDNNMKLRKFIKTTIRGFLNESINNHTLTPEYYLDDFYAVDFNEDDYNEEQALKEIQKVIDYVLSLKYPIKVYRGIDTINPMENYGGGSWSEKLEVAESFGNKIYVGIIPNKDVVDIEQTIRTRIMNEFEYEIYVPNFDYVKIIDTYEKKLG